MPALTMAKAGQSGVLARDHDRHVVVEDLDREVVAPLTEQLLGLLLDDYSGPMMRIDDVVSLFEYALNRGHLGAGLYRFFC